MTSSFDSFKKTLESKEFGDALSTYIKNEQAKRTPDECCICHKLITSSKRLYLNCNDHPQDPHCHSCDGGKGCLLAIGSDCARKFKGKVKEAV